MSALLPPAYRPPVPMKGLILAGGKGTRLRPLTYTMAKQLVPVANQPILWFALNSLVSAGIHTIGIVISPETGDSIAAAVAQWQAQLDFEVHIGFIVQDEPKGLAHAVQVAEPFLGRSQPFLMYLGDNLIEAPLSPVVDRFLAGANDAAIWLKPVDNPSAFGVAELDNQSTERRVIRLIEKPKEPPSNLALVGVYLFRPEIFEAIWAIPPSARGELEITDAIQHLITYGKAVHADILEGWWLDTGKKDDLLAANQTVLQDWLTPKQAGHIDSDSTCNGVVAIGENTTITHCQITGPVMIGPNCQLSNCVIGPNTSIGPNSQLHGVHLSNSVLLADCQLRQLPFAVTHSLMGQGCQVISEAQAQGLPTWSQHLNLADYSTIVVA